MSILEKLTIQNLRKNKRRTIVTILGVMLSSALILAVVGMVTSFQKMMLNVAIAETGDYQEVYQEVPTDALKYIEENQHVSSYYYSEPVTKEKVGPEALEYYDDYVSVPYSISAYDRLDSLPDTKKSHYNIYVKYDNPRDYTSIHDQILATLKDATGKPINVRTNQDLLRAYGVMNDQALETIYWLAVIIVGIIVVTSIFVIRNSFSISATERSRQFGMLSSIGATPRQIRHSVLFEGLVIGAIGIPLGLILGGIAVAILVVIVNYLLGDMIVAPIEFSLPLWIFPLVIILSFLTILLSCLMPAIHASRMSAIDAIRGNQDIKVKAKKLRTPKYIKRAFGIGGVIAHKNLKRSRKKYRTTVISIVLSVATFVGLSSFLTYGKKTINLEYHESDAEIVVRGADEEFYQDFAQKFQLQDYVSYYSIPTSELYIYFMNAESFQKYAESLGIRSQDYSRVAIMNPQTLTYDYEDSAYKVIELDGAKEGKPYPVELLQYRCETIESAENWCSYTDTAGTVKIDIPLTKITSARPLGLESSSQAIIYLPDNYYQKAAIAKVSGNLEDTLRNEFIATNVGDLEAIDKYMAEFEETQDKYAHFYYQNVRETYKQMQNMILLMEIFLYGFIGVVTLIGVTNIFNTITTNIALRAKEFAMLKSIGMTSREFNHMIRLESLMYATKALLIGLPIGIALSYAFYLSVANSIDFGFIFPWVAVLISVAAVSVLIGVIMRYSVKQVEKQNIIETIRSENT